MDSDPEDSYYILVPVLDYSTMSWTVDGIQQKKED